MTVTLPEHNALAADAAILPPTELRVFYSGKWLSRYALACGYQEHCITTDRRSWIRLFQDSPGSGVFHVRGILEDERYWEVYDSLRDARRDFRRIIARKSFKGAQRK